MPQKVGDKSREDIGRLGGIGTEGFITIQAHSPPETGTEPVVHESQDSFAVSKHL